MDHSPDPFVLGKHALTVAQLARLAAGGSGAQLSLDPACKANLDRVRASLVAALQNPNDSRRLYGINTGFADNRDVSLNIQEQSVLQENLVRSHASGYGDAIPTEVVRGAIVARAQSLSFGYSGVRSAVVERLCDLYNSGLIPVIPTFGSVGASGDLAPLSHLALALIGEGEFEDGGNFEGLTYDPASEGFGDGFKLAKLGAKEGLALNNGTSFMATWLALSVFHAENLLSHARLALAMSMEALFGVTHAFLPRVQAVRPHSSIQLESELLLELLEGSSAVRWDSDERTLKAKEARPDDPQDDYCLRSATVGFGAVRQSITHAHQVATSELASATDNPVVLESSRGVDVWSGSHFHGAILALPADYLRAAVAEVASLSERRTAKLVDRKRNYGLPNYLVGSESLQGIESGWMMAQYTSASMVNQLKTRSMPYGVDTIPTGNNAEDYVSMGANATRATYESLDAAYGVVAIELLTAARALHLRVRNGLPESALATATRQTYTALVDVCDLADDGDQPLTGKFALAAELMKSESLPGLQSRSIAV